MNVKEYAEKNGITLDQAYEETGLQYWNQKVTNSNQKKSSSKSTTKASSNDKGRTKKRIKQIVQKGEKLRKLLGDNNSIFLGYIAKYREHFPETYKEVKHLIDIKV